MEIGDTDMSELKQQLEAMNLSSENTSAEINQEIADIFEKAGYTVVIQDYGRPWGGFNQFDNKNAEQFIKEFFPELSYDEARLGNKDSELSPKILVVAPEQRLSWQYHDRRAERWVYLSTGGYFKSLTDEQGELQLAHAGDVVQFKQGERHRLVGDKDSFTLVAEIWQHTQPSYLSNESDIIRLADDYKR